MYSSRTRTLTGFKFPAQIIGQVMPKNHTRSKTRPYLNCVCINNMCTLFQSRPNFYVAFIELILGLFWFVGFHCIFFKIVSIQFSQGFALARSQIRDIATKLVSTWFAITTCLAGWLGETLTSNFPKDILKMCPPIFKCLGNVIRI